MAKGKTRAKSKRRPAPNRRKSASLPKFAIKPSTIAIYVLVFVNSVLIFSSAHKLFQKAVDVSIEAEEQPLKIEVLNGCGESNIAANFSNTLMYKDYQVISQGNADHWNYEYSILIDLGSGNERAIERFRKELGLRPNDVVRIDEKSEADVRLIIGKDYQSLKVYNTLQ